VPDPDRSAGKTSVKIKSRQRQSGRWRRSRLTLKNSLWVCDRGLLHTRKRRGQRDALQTVNAKRERHRAPNADRVNRDLCVSVFHQFTVFPNPLYARPTVTDSTFSQPQASGNAARMPENNPITIFLSTIFYKFF
jgi:hypothetical protein